MENAVLVELNDVDRTKQLRAGNSPKPRNHGQWQVFMKIYGVKTSKELAELYQVAPSTIRTWAQEGRKRGF